MVFGVWPHSAGMPEMEIDEALRQKPASWPAQEEETEDPCDP